MLENYFLLEISSTEEITSFHLVGLSIFTWLKWFSITMCLAGIGYFLYNKLFKRVAPFLLISPVLIACFAFFNRGVLNELMETQIGISYIVLIVLAFRFSKNPPQIK